MNITVYPTTLSGTVTAPASKSLTHRAFICAALADDTSIIKNPLLADDTIHTKNALISLGAKFTFGKESLHITPPKLYLNCNKAIECGNSGATMRFLIPILTQLQNGFTLKGSKRLIERIHLEDLNALNLNFIKTPNTINVFHGDIPNNLTLSDQRSSQLISGLILMAPKTDQAMEITIKNNHLDPYIKMTLSIIERFGINYKLENKNNKTITIAIPEHQSYHATHLEIEGDYSSSANLLVMGALGKKIIVQDLPKNSIQGDSAIIPILKEMNVDIEMGKNMVKVSKSYPTPITLDLSEIPDLGPILMGLASLSSGTSTFTGLKRLYLKESNRVRSTIQVLTELGAKIEQVDQTIVIHGQEYLPGGVTVDSWNDHRIVLMVCALSSRFISPVKILNAQAVDKSFPTFWKEFRALGADFQEEKR